MMSNAAHSTSIRKISREGGQCNLKAKGYVTKLDVLVSVRDNSSSSSYRLTFLITSTLQDQNVVEFCAQKFAQGIKEDKCVFSLARTVALAQRR